jgi:TRAP-type C4-dicarboxylate transport system substrate-binding protein
MIQLYQINFRERGEANMQSEASRALIKQLKNRMDGQGNRGMAEQLGVKYHTWRQVQNGSREMNITVLSAAVRTFPELSANVLDFLRNWQGDHASTTD